MQVPCKSKCLIQLIVYCSVVSEDPGIDGLVIGVLSAYFRRGEIVKKYLARSNMLSSGKDRNREGEN